MKFASNLRVILWTLPFLLLTWFLALADFILALLSAFPESWQIAQKLEIEYQENKLSDL